MVSNFKWNPNAEDEIKRQVKTVTEEAITEVAQFHSGKPKSEVRAALIAATNRRGKFEPSDDMVEAISKG